MRYTLLALLGVVRPVMPFAGVGARAASSLVTMMAEPPPLTPQAAVSPPAQSPCVIKVVGVGGGGGNAVNRMYETVRICLFCTQYFEETAENQ